MVKIFMIIGLIFNSSAIFADTTSIDNNKKLSEGLDAINQYSENFCQRPSFDSKATNIQFAGDVEFIKLFKKLVNLGFSVKYDESNFHGVAQRDIPNVYSTYVYCKVAVYDRIYKNFIPPQKIVITHDKNVSFYDRLIRDQHPTKLTVSKLEILQFTGANEPYMVVIVKNVSDVTANNVNVKFLSTSGKEIQGMQNINQLYRGKNLAVRAGQEQVIPIAPVSQYVEMIYPEDSNARIIDFISSDERIDQASLQNRICSTVKSDFNSCTYQAILRPLIIELSYDSIFDEKMTSLSQMINIFLDGKIQVS